MSDAAEDIVTLGDDVVQETPQPEEAQEPEAKEPEAPEAEQESEPEEGRIEFSPEQQAKVDAILAKNTARLKGKTDAIEAERQQLAQELEQLREQAGVQQAPADPQTGEPIIPAYPDPFEPGYEQKLAERDEALKAHASWEKEQEIVQRQQVVEQEKALDDLNKRTQGFIENAKEHGLGPEDIRRAGETINDAGGLHPMVISELLDDDAGAAISDYLSRNGDELEKVQAMMPTKAAVYLATQIKPRAVKNAKRRSAPPPPVSTEKGAGGKEDDGPPGASFE